MIAWFGVHMRFESRWLLSGMALMLMNAGGAMGCGDDDDDRVTDRADAGGASGAGSGGMSGSTAGVAGKIGEFCASPPAPCRDPDAACRQSATRVADGRVGVKCINCLCGMKPQETSACSSDCFQLAVCVAANCDASNTNCIIETCSDAAGGAVQVVAVGALVRATPFTACAAECFPPIELPNDDGGDDAGQ